MAYIRFRGRSWECFWRLNGTRDGDTQYTRWPSEDLAKEAKALAEARGHRITKREVEDIIVGPVEVVDEGPTLREWIEKWLTSKTRITEGTRGNYESYLRLHVYPQLGDKPIARITGVDIGTAINAWRAKGRKNTSITRYYSLLYGAFKAAIVAGLIETNPCQATDFVRDQVAEDDAGDDDHVYLTFDEFRLLRGAFDARDQRLLDFLVNTGERWGEATANAVDSVVLDGAPLVHVVRAWKKAKGGRRRLGPTKGRRKRDVTIDGHLVTVLRPLVAGRSGKAYLFVDADGKPYDYDHFYRYVWVPKVAALMVCTEHPPPDRGRQVPVGDLAGRRCGELGGVNDDGTVCGSRVVTGWDRCSMHRGPEPDATSDCACPGRLTRRPTPHDLRHTHAAWLLSSGRVSMRALQLRLGHQSITTTEVYAGLLPDADRHVLDALSSANAAVSGPSAAGR